MRDTKVTEPVIAETVLDWYDRNARALPWRVSPADGARGVRPDPYRVWLSEVMLQQTTVAAVRGYFERFTRRWPTVQALAGADDADVMAEWAGLGYYARARNLLRCARAVERDHGGAFPPLALQSLPGIGPYTAAAIAAIAFDAPATVVDGNVERVMARLFGVQTALPAAKPALYRHAEGLTPTLRPGDYAQAVMDLGATICTPRNPACALCPLQPHCKAHAAGIMTDLPRRSAKPPKPTRTGILWLAFRPDGAVLLERRPARGLLGGMLGFPGSGWDGATRDAPLPAVWITMGEVRHTFTHFHLILTVLCTQTTADHPGFRPHNAFSPDDLPSLMRKAHDLTANRVIKG